MNIQPTLVLNVDTTALARLIGKRKWHKAFKELCEAAEQRADKDYLDKIRSSEMMKAVIEHSERKARNYTKADGTTEGSVVVEMMDRLWQYKQERFDFYLKSMMHLVEVEIRSSVNQ